MTRYYRLDEHCQQHEVLRQTAGMHVYYVDAKTFGQVPVLEVYQQEDEKGMDVVTEQPDYQINRQHLTPPADMDVLKVQPTYNIYENVDFTQVPTAEETKAAMEAPYGPPTPEELTIKTIETLDIHVERDYAPQTIFGTDPHYEHINLGPPKPLHKEASEYANIAADLVSGDRAKDYGDKQTNFQTIADFWSVFLSARHNSPVTVTAVDVALLMDLLKTARAINGRFKDDTFIDKAGYAAIAGELAERAEMSSSMSEKL